MPGSLEDTPLTVLATLEQSQQLKTELMNVKEFAVDVDVMIWTVNEIPYPQLHNEW